MPFNSSSLRSLLDQVRQSVQADIGLNLPGVAINVTTRTKKPVLLTSSADQAGLAVTLHFDIPLDAAKPPALSQFGVSNGGVPVDIMNMIITGSTLQLVLESPLDRAQDVTVSYEDSSRANNKNAIQSQNGMDADSFSVSVTNFLSTEQSGDTSFGAVSSIELAGAEISAYDATSKRLFVTSGDGLQIVQLDDQLNMQLINTVSFIEAFGSNGLNSVAVSNAGVVAVAVAAADKTQAGRVFLLNADGVILNSIAVGALPDMLTFSADGKTLLVANEGERNTADDIAAGASNIDPEGSVSIVDLGNGAENATVRTATFTDYNSSLEQLKAEGVRLFAGQGIEGYENTTVAQDLEPEYISISPDGKTAFVTLQEANSIAILDIATGRFTDIVALGLTAYQGMPADFTDKDGGLNLRSDLPIFGQYMPDAISTFVGDDGKTYYVIANEGDDRDDFTSETIRLKDVVLDPSLDQYDLQSNGVAGRLNVSQLAGMNGDLDGDGDVDQVISYGARSFSILDDQGNMVFDSGSHIEQFVVDNNLGDDGRSDNKGPEPEGVTIGVVNGRTLAFVGLERGDGGVMVYDVTNPANVEFVQYLNRDGDVSPEGLTFISADKSPTGMELLVTTNEVSNTATIYQQVTRISDIQGEGDASPLEGQQVTVSARITNVDAGMKLFYVQEERTDWDNNSLTSEGVAVFSSTLDMSTLNVGDLVTFTGTVSEYFGLTEIVLGSEVRVVHAGDASDLDAPVKVTLPIANGETLERYEGMLIEVSAESGGDLHVADTFTFSRYGEATFYADAVPEQFTQGNAPSIDGQAAYTEFLARNSIKLDDGFSYQNPFLADLNAGTMIVRDGEQLGPDANGNVNYIRVGDTASSLTGVLGYGFGSYSLNATQTVELAGAAREAAPDAAAIGNADIRLASFNVLNYFTTLGSSSFITPDGTSQNGRGANSAVEFTQQQAKIVNAMLGTGAAVFGLNEIQNNGFGADSAIVSLVTALNAADGSDRFTFVIPDKTGSDAIMTAIVYDKTQVTPLGNAVTPDTGIYTAFADLNRMPIAQTFGYADDLSKQLTVVVNHLKSKGGAGEGADADIGDGQGNFNATRTLAAEQLSDWLATNPTTAADGDYLLLGDLNSYAKEDPVKALESAGFSNLIKEGDYGYIFNGLRGTLDYALAKGLDGEITGFDHWNINSDEQIVLDYNDEFVRDPAELLDRDDLYRSSDHDPVVVGVRLNSEAGSPAAVTPVVVPSGNNSGGGQGGGAGEAPAVFISELHYDNVGTDEGEAVGIQGAAGTDLTGWSVVFYNGSNGASYRTQSLDGLIIDDEGNGQGEISFSLPANGIQNGAPDGLALVNASGTVVQFLSYEGTMIAVGGPADGMSSTDIGVEEVSSTPVGFSLQLVGGVWQNAASESFGFLNA